MGFADLVGICIGVSAIVGAGFAVWKLGKATFLGLRRVMRFIDDMTGEPARPGADERPGVLARLGKIEDNLTDVRDVKAAVQEIRLTLADIIPRLAAVEAELKPNGGNSLRDAVDMRNAVESERIAA